MKKKILSELFAPVTAVGYLDCHLDYTVDTRVNSIWLSITHGPETLAYDVKVGKPVGKEYYEAYPPVAELRVDIPWGANYTYL